MGPPLTNDFVVEDATQRRTRIQANAIEQLMFWDEAAWNADDFLANKDGFIRDRSRFVRTFRALVGKGCNAQAFSQSLCYFRAYQTARSTHSGRTKARFPSRARICKVVSTLRDASDQVFDLELNYDPSQAVRDPERFRKEAAATRAAVESSKAFRDLSNRGKELMRQSSKREDRWLSRPDKYVGMAEDMKDYAAILELWEPPRADSIRVYGLIAPAIYCKIATGKPRYELLTELFSSCGRKDGDLRKRVTYFEKHFSQPYRIVEERLEMIHENGGLPWYVPNVDFYELLDKLEKSTA
jgi:hypothetical protein